MKNGHRWLAFDADFVDNPFTMRLVRRFGPVGGYAWVTFLCACKRSTPPGTLSYTSDDHARRQLGLLNVELVDQDGKGWTLDDLWTFTGHQKQTRRTSHGGRTHVRSTQWERWQKDEQTSDERERKRRWRAKNGRDIGGTMSQGCPENVPLEIEKEKEKEISPPTPSPTTGGGIPRNPPEKRRGNGSTSNPKDEPDRLVDWLRECIPGTGHRAAAMAVDRMRARGIGDTLIEEACGYASKHGGNSALYVEQVALDWMGQRDPTRNATADDLTTPRHIGDALGEIRR